jgi:hypothetical protein
MEKVPRRTCGKSIIHHFEHVIKQETHIFAKMTNNYQNFTKKKSLPNFLENSRNFTKSKTFYQIWSHCGNISAPNISHYAVRSLQCTLGLFGSEYMVHGMGWDGSNCLCQ